MARSRNIKPGFMTNEDLADNEPLGRLLFLGLTMLADFKGDIEWRPKRIKIQTLPYDNCDIEKLAINLDHSGFIRFYSDGEKIYVNIPNFLKHQNPHKNEREKGSDIPSYTDECRQTVDLKALTINRDKSRAKPEDSTSDPADSFIPNPSSLNPDSLIPDQKQKTTGRFQRPTILQVEDYLFEKTGKPDKPLANKFFNHYEANGWKVGKNAMKNWKAAVNSWLTRENNNENNRPNHSRPASVARLTPAQQLREQIRQESGIDLSKAL